MRVGRHLAVVKYGRAPEGGTHDGMRGACEAAAAAFRPSCSSDFFTIPSIRVCVSAWREAGTNQLYYNPSLETSFF